MRVWTLIAAILAFTAQTANAQTAPLRVLASNGMKAVIEDLKPRLQRELRRPLDVQFNTSASTRQRIEAGEAFDVAILTAEVIDELAKTRMVSVGSIGNLGRSGIGFGIRAGSTRRNVATPDAVRQTLLNAKSLTWVGAGASRVHIDRMIEGLGIASELRSKTILTGGVDESLALITAGKAELIITLMSEIVPAKGVQYLGPLPPQFQKYVAFSAGVSPKSSATAVASQLIRLLSAPSTVPVYEAKGMELPVMRNIRPVIRPLK